MRALVVYESMYGNTHVVAGNIADGLRHVRGDPHARAVRACCESDPAFGYELTRRLARVVAKRLQATRVRLITTSSQPAGAR